MRCSTPRARALGEGVLFYAGAYADGGGRTRPTGCAGSVEAIDGARRPAGDRAEPGHARPGGRRRRRRFYAAAVEAAPAGALAFELSPRFAPHGEIWDDETFERDARASSAILGAKHSSLERDARAAASGRARRCAARLPRLHRQRPRHRHGGLRERLPARASPPSRRIASPSATAHWPAGDARLPGAQRRAPAPGQRRLPRADPRLQARRRPVPAPVRPARRRRDPPACAATSRTRTACCSSTAPGVSTCWTIPSAPGGSASSPTSEADAPQMKGRRSSTRRRGRSLRSSPGSTRCSSASAQTAPNSRCRSPAPSSASRSRSARNPT